MSKLNWSTVQKISVIFGIIGGLFLFYNIYQNFKGDNFKVKADFLQYKFNTPLKTQSVYHEGIIEDSLNHELNRFDLAEIIFDSIVQYESDKNFYDYRLKNKIREGIPSFIDKSKIADKIGKVFSDIYKPLNYPELYTELNFENFDTKPISNLRLEIPNSKGYFEIYENEKLYGEGDFDSFVSIGKVRAGNNILIKIWSNYYYSDKSIRFSFDEGLIFPIKKEIILGKGILFWIMKNFSLAIYFGLLALWVIYLIYLVIFK